MKTHVTVIPADRFILVDGQGLVFDFSSPETLHALQWREGAGHLEFTDETPNLPLTREDYEREVASFVAAWEAEKARLEEEANRPPTLEEARAQKLAEIGEAFAKAEASGVVQSRLGFPVDATERANRDVSGLITMLEDTGKDEAVFCDADNSMRPVTLADLKTIRLEIIAHGQALYAKKWVLREAVNAAATVEAVQAVAWAEEPAAGPDGRAAEEPENRPDTEPEEKPEEGTTL